MKNFILLIALFACTTAIYAQNPRITSVGDSKMHTFSFQKGGDSLMYNIVGKNDTVKTTEYYRSGKIQSIVWKKDSSYGYDKLGRLRRKGFGLAEYPTDNAKNVYFYPNGGIESIKASQNGKSEQFFDENGHLLYAFRNKNAPPQYIEQKIDRNGVLIASEKTDSTLYNGKEVELHFDTVYYDNGKVYSTSIKRHNESFGVQFYAKDGSLLRKTMPDSLNLVLFKDNVNCYFGLKNQKGDTVVKPRFDDIENFNDDFWAATSGESVIFLDPKGAPMPPFSNKISKVYRMTQPINKENTLRFSENKDIQTRYYLQNNSSHYYQFKEDNNWGIMDGNGKILMPPQYFSPFYSFIPDDLWFEFAEQKKDTTLRRGFLSTKGKPMFSETFTDVSFTQFQDYFYLGYIQNLKNNAFQYANFNADKLNTDTTLLKKALKYTIGLGKAEDAVILNPKFFKLEHINYTDLFKATVLKHNQDGKTVFLCNGIFNVRTKTWLLDTTHFKVVSDYSEKPKFFKIMDILSKKYGIMDTLGGFVVPIVYDSIEYANIEQGIYTLKKNNQYQILEIKQGKPFIHKSKYDFLSGVKFSDGYSDEYHSISYFIAQQKNKYGVINLEEKVIKPFEYDYAATDIGYSTIILVKNNQATAFDLESLPNETVNLPYFNKWSDPKKAYGYLAVNSGGKYFFVDRLGKILLPPQYKSLTFFDHNSIEAVVEDDKHQKKVVFFKTAQVVDFPFDFRIRRAIPESRLMIVEDSTENSFGVVSTDGKLLMPCQNYAIAIGDANANVYFAKQDTPMILRSKFLDNAYGNNSVNGDSLTIEDTNWRMFGGNGTQIGGKSFRFPIDFQEGVGIGMQDDVFNLYKTDGTILMPFQKNNAPNLKNTEGVKNAEQGNNQNRWTFKNIRRDEKKGFYTLFFNQGLTPTVIMTKADGEILVNNGRYDGISHFYGHYALVSANKKIGLIDTLGNEVIAPQDLRTYTGHFTDSLDIVNKKNRALRAAEGNSALDDFVMLPFTLGDSPLINPDSLDIKTEQRAALWNLLLEKSRFGWVNTASDLRIPRVNLRENTSFLSLNSTKDDNFYTEPKIMSLSDSTIAFALTNEASSYRNESIFYNFYRRNGRYEELHIHDVLQIQGQKRQDFNDALIKKVKALKDAFIDCSNPENFVGQVENAFLLTKTGIDFCFESHGEKTFDIVSFTWSELTPFLKIKIY